MKRETILSYGGGIDSTLLVLIDHYRLRAVDMLGITLDQLNKVFPPIDRIIFSDTGSEFSHTYDTISKIKSLVLDKLTIVRKQGETIEEWCLRLGTVPVMPGGSHICSRRYKGDVMAAYVKSLEITPTWIIGIECGEGSRVKRFTKPKGDQAEYLYPLITLGLDRNRITWMLDCFGWGHVQKSSCFFCPFMKKWEIVNLIKNHPDEWERAKQIEYNFQATSPLKHQAWLDAGQPVDSAGRALRGMWKKDSYAEGARLFGTTHEGKILSVDEWENLIYRIDD